ncbi:MAG TPA: hypothetical protein VK550_26495 [Polyangiaceae bacterium]|nr:hypothetical protein [Polyangiaceae bacterium]
MRTLWSASPRCERQTDLKLIAFGLIGFAIGCAPGDDEAGADAARDNGRNAADASTMPDRSEHDAASSDASEDDDALRGLVLLPAQFTQEDMPLRMLGEGDRIDLWPAPQGGHVVLVAAKVKNLVGDTAILRVRVRYPDTPFIVAEEARSVKMVPVPGEEGTMQPDLRTRTQVAHVPLCPDYDPMDIVDRPLEFAISMTSIGSEDLQSGAISLLLYPTCVPGSADEAFCKCECRANYVLGKCPRDAGSD